MNPLKLPLKLVTLPWKGVKKVEKTLYTQLALMILRHALTAAGFTELISDSELNQLIGAVMTTGGLVWSAWRKIKRSRTLIP